MHHFFIIMAKTNSPKRAFTKNNFREENTVIYKDAFIWTISQVERHIDMEFVYVCLAKVLTSPNYSDINPVNFLFVWLSALGFDKWHWDETRPSRDYNQQYRSFH